MRDVMFGVAGMGVGGVVGVTATIALEAIGLVVVAGLWFAQPAAPPTALGVVAPVVAAAPAVAVAAPAKAAPAVGAPGEVQLHTLAMVRPMLDGAPMEWNAAIGAWSAAAAPGTHRLQLFDAFGTAVKAEANVKVEAGRRSQLRFAKGSLTNNGTMPMGSASVAPAAAELEVAVVSAVAAPALTVSVTAGPDGATAFVGDGSVAAEVAPAKGQIGVSVEGGRASITTGVGTLDLKIPRVLGGGRR